MSVHVSLAAGPTFLIGDVPATFAELIDRVKLVLNLEDNAAVSLQYQDESGTRVDLSSESSLKAAGSCLNVLFAEIIDDWVRVDASDSELHEFPKQLATEPESKRAEPALESHIITRNGLDNGFAEVENQKLRIETSPTDCNQACGAPASKDERQQTAEATERVQSATSHMTMQVTDTEKKLKMEIEMLRAEVKRAVDEADAATALVKELQKTAKSAAAHLDKANRELVDVKIVAGVAVEEGERSRVAAAALGAELGQLKVRFTEMEALCKKETTLRKKYFNIIEDMKGKIRVCCRVRPFNQMEIEKVSVPATFCPDDMTIEVQTSHDKKYFTFDKCFHSNASQEAVFESTRHLVQSALDGYNVCILAYGQSGSGKTYTMYGNPEMPGIVPRAIAELYRLVEENKSTLETQVRCYMVQLYNDTLLDLFSQKDEEKPLRIKQNAQGVVFVQGVTMQECTTLDELLRFQQSGYSKRTTARSHTIFSIIVESKNMITGAISLGKLSLVELAGSELARKIGLSGDQLKEAQSINMSLSALGDVIGCLSGGEKFVPYRNNKLTMLLQDCLGGNAKTIVFVNVSPSECNADETTRSLTYGQRFKMITNAATKAFASPESRRFKEGPYALEECGVKSSMSAPAPAPASSCAVDAKHTFSNDKDRADFFIRNRSWRRRLTLERSGDIGWMPCANLEHDDYDVVPVERNGHCLFLCFLDILRQRNVAGRPATHQAMRGVIADYFEQHDGVVTHEGAQYPCDEAIRTNGYGGVTEVIAFASKYNLSIEIHSPETSECVQKILCGGAEAAPELLLQTLAWQDNGSRAPAGDHWQRLRKKSFADLHQMKDSYFAQTDAIITFRPAVRSGAVASGSTGSISSDEWEPQPTSSGSVFFRHKVTGESRWIVPAAGAVAGQSACNSVGSGQDADVTPHPLTNSFLLAAPQLPPIRVADITARQQSDSFRFLDADDAALNHIDVFVTDYKLKCIQQLPVANVTQRELLGSTLEVKRPEIMLIVKEQLAFDHARYIKNNATFHESITLLEKDVASQKKILEAFLSDPSTPTLEITQQRILVDAGESLVYDLSEIEDTLRHVRGHLSRKLREEFVLQMLRPCVDESEKQTLIADLNKRCEQMDKALLEEQQRQLVKVKRANTKFKQQRIERHRWQQALIQLVQFNNAHAKETDNPSSAIPKVSVEEHVLRLDEEMNEQEQESLLQLRSRLEGLKKELLQQEARNIGCASVTDTASGGGDAPNCNYHNILVRVSNCLDLEQAKQEQDLSDACFQLKEHKTAKLQQKCLLQQQREQVKAEQKARLITVVSRQQQVFEKHAASIQKELSEEAARIEADEMKRMIWLLENAFAASMDGLNNEHLTEKIHALDQCFESNKLRQSEGFERRMKHARSAMAEKTAELIHRHHRELEKVIFEMDVEAEHLEKALVLFDDSDTEEILHTTCNTQPDDMLFVNFHIPAERLAVIAASEAGRDNTMKAAQVELRERLMCQHIEMGARHMTNVARVTSGALLLLEVSQQRQMKDALVSLEGALLVLSGEELDKAKLDHLIAMQSMNVKHKMEQADVEGRVLQQLADTHKYESALFDRRRKAALHQSASGEIIDVDPLSSGSDDITAQVIESLQIMNEDKKFALQKLYADQQRFIAEERLKAIAEEEAFLAGLQEEKKKKIEALHALQQQELKVQKKQLTQTQSVEERELIITTHMDKLQNIEADIKVERQKLERAASERLEKMKQRKAELRKAKLISDVNVNSELNRANFLEKRIERLDSINHADEARHEATLRKVIDLWQAVCPQSRGEPVTLKAIKRFKELLNNRIQRLGSIDSRRMPQLHPQPCEPRLLAIAALCHETVAVAATSPHAKNTPQLQLARSILAVLQQ